MLARLALVTAALVAAFPAGAGGLAAPPATVKVLECSREAHAATFHGRMARIEATQRMSMRFTLRGEARHRLRGDRGARPRALAQLQARRGGVRLPPDRPRASAGGDLPHEGRLPLEGRERQGDRAGPAALARLPPVRAAPEPDGAARGRRGHRRARRAALRRAGGQQAAVARAAGRGRAPHGRQRRGRHRHGGAAQARRRQAARVPRPRVRPHRQRGRRSRRADRGVLGGRQHAGALLRPTAASAKARLPGRRYHRRRERLPFEQRSRAGSPARGHPGRPGGRPGGARGRDDARRVHLGGGGAQAERRAARRRRRGLQGGSHGRDRDRLGSARLLDQAPPPAAAAGGARRGGARGVAQDRLPRAQHLGQRAGPARRGGREAGDRRRRLGRARSSSRCCSRSACSSCCPPA